MTLSCIDQPLEIVETLRNEKCNDFLASGVTEEYLDSLPLKSVGDWRHVNRLIAHKIYYLEKNKGFFPISKASLPVSELWIYRYKNGFDKKLETLKELDPVFFERVDRF